MTSSITDPPGNPFPTHTVAPDFGKREKNYTKDFLPRNGFDAHSGWARRVSGV
jgi:hypothetical protein